MGLTGVQHDTYWPVHFVYPVKIIFTEPIMCEPITVPECSVGLDYTTAIPNYPLGMSNSDKQSMLSSLSVIFESTCGRFFRPFMCSAFLPPCRDRVVPPCRELCFLAVKKCVETFDGVLSAEDLMASGGSGGSCDMMPSEADGQCYNGELYFVSLILILADRLFFFLFFLPFSLLGERVFKCLVL